MRYYALTGAFANYTTSGAPSAFNITASMVDAAVPNKGSWIGGAPRITRRGGFAAGLHLFSRQYQTYVTWVYGLPDTYTADQLAATIADLRRRVDAAMNATDDSWTNVLISPWTQERNGSIAFWQTGQASNTRTAESFATFNADEVENPYGPTTAETQPGSLLGGGPPGTVSSLTQMIELVRLSAMIIVPVVVVGFFVAYVPPRVLPWNWDMWKKKPEENRPQLGASEAALEGERSGRRETLPPAPLPA